MSEIITYADSKFVILRNFLPISRDVLIDLWNSHPKDRDKFMSHFIPRFISNHGPSYKFGGVVHKTVPINNKLVSMLFGLVSCLETSLREQTDNENHKTPNNILVNYYGDEKDSISPHSDKESANGAVFSFVFGDGGHFVLRDCKSKEKPLRIQMRNGDAIIMLPGSQVSTTHEVPKGSDKYPRKGIRVSVTIRKVEFSDEELIVNPNFLYEERIFTNFAESLAKSIINEDSEKIDKLCKIMKNHAACLGFQITDSEYLIMVNEIEKDFNEKYRS